VLASDGAELAWNAMGAEAVAAPGVERTFRRSELAARGRELREDGLTVLRAYRVLKREYPNAERDELWVAAGADLGTGWPLWADRSSPRPAAIRNDPRK
jgi:hypothetical protein